MKNTGNLNRGPYVEFALYIPVSLLEEVDRLVSEGKYESRSRLVREAIRQLLSKLTGKPHEVSEPVQVSTARVVARRGVNPYKMAKELLRDYIIHELSDGRFKANIKDNNSPVMLTLTQFRAFVWRRAKTDDLLKLYVKKVSRKSTTTVMEDRPRRRDLLAEAWQRYTVKYLDELVTMGIVKEWWRKKTTIGYKYYVLAVSAMNGGFSAPTGSTNHQVWNPSRGQHHISGPSASYGQVGTHCLSGSSQPNTMNNPQHDLKTYPTPSPEGNNTYSTRW